MSSVIGAEDRWYVCDIIKKYEKNMMKTHVESNGFHGDSLVFVELNKTAQLMLLYDAQRSLRGFPRNCSNASGL